MPIVGETSENFEDKIALRNQRNNFLTVHVPEHTFRLENFSSEIKVLESEKVIEWE